MAKKKNESQISSEKINSYLDRIQRIEEGAMEINANLSETINRLSEIIKNQGNCITNLIDFLNEHFREEIENDEHLITMIKLICRQATYSLNLKSDKTISHDNYMIAEGFKE